MYVLHTDKNHFLFLFNNVIKYIRKRNINKHYDILVGFDGLAYTQL